MKIPKFSTVKHEKKNKLLKVKEGTLFKSDKNNTVVGKKKNKKLTESLVKAIENELEGDFVKKHKNKAAENNSNEKQIDKVVDVDIANHGEIPNKKKKKTTVKKDESDCEEDSNTVNKKTKHEGKKKRLSMYTPLQSQTEENDESTADISPKKKKKLRPTSEPYKPGTLSNTLQTKLHGQLVLPWDSSFGLDPDYKPSEQAGGEKSKLKINPLFDLSKRTEEMDSKTIIVGNLPIDTKKSQLLTHFKSCGKIIDCKIKRNKRDSNNIKTAKAHLILLSCDQIENALKLNGSLFENHHLKVFSKQGGENISQVSVFVGNIHFEAEDDHLWKIFEKCGPIENVRIIRDSRSGRGKGYGYVNFKSVESLEPALELNGTKLLDRELRVVRHDSKARSVSNTETINKHKLKNKKRRKNQQPKVSGQSNDKKTDFNTKKKGKKSDSVEGENVTNVANKKNNASPDKVQNVSKIVEENGHSKKKKSLNLTEIGNSSEKVKNKKKKSKTSESE